MNPCFSARRTIFSLIEYFRLGQGSDASPRVSSALTNLCAQKLAQLGRILHDRQVALPNGLNCSHSRCAGLRLVKSASRSKTDPIFFSGNDTVSQHLCTSPFGTTMKSKGRRAEQIPMKLGGYGNSASPR